MILGQIRQGFGIAQDGEAIAAPPKPGRRAGVPEQAVVLLDTGSEQELGEQVEVACFAGEPEGAAQHGAVHEHVLGAEVRVGRRRRAAVGARLVAVGHLHGQVGITAVAGRFGQLHGPDQPRQRRCAGLVLEPRLVAVHVGRHDVRDGRGGVGVGGVEARQTQATAEAHSLRVDHGFEGMAVEGGHQTGDAQGRTGAADVEFPAGRRRSEPRGLLQHRPQTAQLLRQCGGGNGEPQARHGADTVCHVAAERRQEGAGGLLHAGGVDGGGQQGRRCRR